MAAEVRKSSPAFCPNGSFPGRRRIPALTSPAWREARAVLLPSRAASPVIHPVWTPSFPPRRRSLFSVWEAGGDRPTWSKGDREWNGHSCRLHPPWSSVREGRHARVQRVRRGSHVRENVQGRSGDLHPPLLYLQAPKTNTMKILLMLLPLLFVGLRQRFVGVVLALRSRGRALIMAKTAIGGAA